MKKISKYAIMIFAFTVYIMLNQNLYAQQDKSKRPSPPAEVSQKVGEATVTINYSQPAVKEREIWGGLVPYGKVWRTGANEATTFEVSKDVKIEGETLKMGKYGLFTIPEKDEWTIIFNSVPDQWGAFNYSADKDVLRVKVKPAKSSEFKERMTFEISKKGKVTLLWENLAVPFTVSN
jgi:hypothetical protein